MSGNKTEYGGGFLYAEDLIRGGQFQDVTVTIAEYVEPGTEKAGNGDVITKPIIGFEKAQKRLVLCKTNVSVLKYVTGEQPGPEWIGKTITLQARYVKAFGEEVAAIRIVPPVGTKLRKKLIERLGRKATL